MGRKKASIASRIERLSVGESLRFSKAKHLDPSIRHACTVLHYKYETKGGRRYKTDRVTDKKNIIVTRIK